MRSTGLSLRSADFRREREKGWRELEGLVTRVEKGGLASLSERQLRRLALLYRSTLSALSVARAISLDKNLLEYLESLSARAYFTVYGTRRGLRATVADFTLRRFPVELARAWRALLASASAMVAGIAVGFTLTARDADAYYGLMPESMAQGRDPTASTEELRRVLFDGGDEASGVLASFAAHLFSNNSQVSLLAFALGFAAGLPTMLLLFYNGAILGAMAALYHSRGLGVEWWSWVLPHGVTELLAIVVAGAAGLTVGHGLVFPGRHTRLENLAIVGRRAGILVLGAILMLVLAAVLEGFFRQLVGSLSVRYAVVAATSLGWIAYFVHGWRVRRA